MTTTVTTITVSSVTSVGTSAVIGLIAVLLLIAFVVSKEIMTSVPDTRARAVGRVLNVGVVPLLIVFAVILVFKFFPFIG